MWFSKLKVNFNYPDQGSNEIFFWTDYGFLLYPPRNVWSANCTIAERLGCVPALNKYHMVVDLEPWQHCGIWNKIRQWKLILLWNGNKANWICVSQVFFVRNLLRSQFIVEVKQYYLPTACSQVLQSSCCSLQGVGIGALRQQGEVGLDYCWVPQHLNPFGWIHSVWEGPHAVPLWRKRDRCDWDWLRNRCWSDQCRRAKMKTPGCLKHRVISFLPLKKKKILASDIQTF